MFLSCCPKGSFAELVSASLPRLDAQHKKHWNSNFSSVREITTYTTAVISCHAVRRTPLENLFRHLSLSLMLSTKSIGIAILFLFSFSWKKKQKKPPLRLTLLSVLPWLCLYLPGQPRRILVAPQSPCNMQDSQILEFNYTFSPPKFLVMLNLFQHLSIRGSAKKH